MTEQKAKIISWNVGYLLGYDGSFLDYILNSHRALKGGRGEEKRAIDAITGLIEDEDPEVVLLQEIDTGSFRTSTDNQLRQISSRLKEEGKDYGRSSERKYGPESVFSSLPLMKDLGNGVLYRGEKDIKNHHLDSVSKNLVQEAELDNKVSLFSVHAPLREPERKRYMDGLSRLIEEREKAIVCGDFNCSEEMEKVKGLASENDLKIHEPGPTFPACNPEKNFDLMLSSEGLSVDSCKRVDKEISDHLPIEAEIDLP